MSEDSFNVSPQQEQLWLAEPYGPSGRTQATVVLDGSVDGARLQQALRQTVARHESLRTTFAHRPGLRFPLQVIHDRLDPAWQILDLGGLTPGEQAAGLEDSRRGELGAALDFPSGPLVRGLLVSLAADRHVLVLTLSALCADISSVPPLLRELLAGYSGDGAPGPEPLQYADFAQWQRELTVSEEPEALAARAFWSDLEGAVAPALPFARAASTTFVPDEVVVDLDPLSDAVAPALLQAAWQALLGRSAGEDEVVIGVVGPLRRHADLEGAIGAFGRTLPFRARVTGEVTFDELIDELRAAAVQAARYEDYAPADISAGLTIGFLAPETYHARARELDVTLERVAVSGPQFRLWLTYETADRRARLRLSFDPRHVERAAVERLGSQLGLLVTRAAADPSVALAEPDLLEEPERTRLLVEFNDAAAPIPGESVHELIAARAAAAPGRTAVVDEQGSISYGELDARANQLAHRLLRAGVGPEQPVGLCTDRSIGMVVGLLGILKAGGAYLPLHYEHPGARLSAQLQTAGARAIVTQQALLERLPEFAGEVICLDREPLDAEPSSPPEVRVTQANLVYVIYTSGSTGIPKGVGVTHGNLVNYCSYITARLDANAEPLAFGLVTSISTDLGNTSVFGALSSGGTLVLLSPAAAADGAALARQLQLTPVDVLKITPSHLGALLAAQDPQVLPRRWLVIGGERAPWDLVAKIRALSDVSILNHYGPTEATVGCCTFEVAAGPAPYDAASVPIGRPIANSSCYVLDGRGRPVPIGVAGRLLIGGAGVAREYVGQPELSAERFVPDPFAGQPGARMYDTGDLVRWLPDGALEFLGRTDEQVKIRGYRVEPAEVELALRRHQLVDDAVVVVHVSAAGEQRLVAYCTTAGVSTDDLRSHLERLLPEFMLPSLIATLEALPRTPSGKVDRLALPDPEALAHSATGYVAPRGPVEEAVAAVWSQMLAIDKIGVQDDFFELGGHSLLATQTIAQLRSDFAVDLPLHILFLSPTVEGLAAEIVRLTNERGDDGTAELVAELEQLSVQEAKRLASDLAPPSGG
jgi:amino acid adenylation domain-containing protein